MIVRRAATVIEVLLVFGIATVLMGLLLGAVQRVRSEAVRMKSMNRLRQMAIATQNYCSSHRGTLPLNPHADIRSLLEADKDLVYPLGRFIDEPSAVSHTNRPSVPAFQSPADPTLVGTVLIGNSSYAANVCALHKDRLRPASLDDCLDGTANTIAYGECYARCHKTSHDWAMSGAPQTCYDQMGQRITCINPSERGATFADLSFNDVLPVTANGVTAPSVLGVTFQVRPTREACDYRQLQTPHPGGMLTAYLDGSVRTTSPGVSPAVFWAAVTPAGGEVTPPE